MAELYNPVQTFTSVGKTLYVDAVNGSDATSARGMGRPFATVQAATNAAQVGDTVVGRPGHYSEAITLKNGVILFAEPGFVLENASILPGPTVRATGINAQVLGWGTYLRTGPVTGGTSGESPVFWIVGGTAELRGLRSENTIDLDGATTAHSTACILVGEGASVTESFAQSHRSQYDTLLSGGSTGDLTSYTPLIYAEGLGGSAVEWGSAGACKVYGKNLFSAQDQTVIAYGGLVEVHGAEIVSDSINTVGTDGGGVAAYDCVIRATNTDVATRAVQGNNVSISNCRLVVPTSAGASLGYSGQVIKIYATCFGNRPKDTGVTLQVNAAGFVVDANVT